MKAYIASKYIINKEVNQRIYETLTAGGITTFLPESIRVDANTPKENLIVCSRCYDELDTSDVVIWVSPYGESVTAEIGYAIYKKRNTHSMHIILFGCQMKTEAMTTPYIDAIIDIEERREESNYQELLRVVRSFQNER